MLYTVIIRRTPPPPTIGNYSGSYITRSLQLPPQKHTGGASIIGIEFWDSLLLRNHQNNIGKYY